jgi:hypothetical protein
MSGPRNTFGPASGSILGRATPARLHLRTFTAANRTVITATQTASTVSHIMPTRYPPDDQTGTQRPRLMLWMARGKARHYGRAFAVKSPVCFNPP